MTLSRQPIIDAMQQRVSEVYGIGLVRVDPETPPSEDDMPCVNIFTRNDQVVSIERGTKTRQKRDWRIAFEMFIKQTSESAASEEMGAFVQSVKYKLFEEDPNYSGLCAAREESLSEYVRVMGGVMGCVLTVIVRYSEAF